MCIRDRRKGENFTIFLCRSYLFISAFSAQTVVVILMKLKKIYVKADAYNCPVE